MSLKNTMTKLLAYSAGGRVYAVVMLVDTAGGAGKTRAIQDDSSDFWRDFSVEFLAAILKRLGLRLMPR